MQKQKQKEEIMRMKEDIPNHQVGDNSKWFLNKERETNLQQNSKQNHTQQLNGKELR